MSKDICKNISKNLNDKYIQKCLDHSKQSDTDSFETPSKVAIQKTAETTGDLIGNKVANKITRVSINSEQNNSETVTNEKRKFG